MKFGAHLCLTLSCIGWVVCTMTKWNCAVSVYPPLLTSHFQADMACANIASARLYATIERTIEIDATAAVLL